MSPATAIIVAKLLLIIAKELNKNPKLEDSEVLDIIIKILSVAEKDIK